jgi:hypothetical protein
MAFNARTQWDVRTTAAASDVNGGGCAPGLGAKDVTAATDLVVDASNPLIVTSATHNFVGGDVGKFINVTAGTGWQVGYYQIVATGSNAATLDRSPAALSTTGGTYDLYSAIDYSQQNAAQIAYTDMVIDGTTNTNFTSAGNPVTAAHVGNIINVTGGTGFTVQRVQIISQAAGVATCDKSLGTLSSTGGTGNLGGSLLTIPAVVALVVSNNTVHIKAGTYTQTTTILEGISGNIRYLGYGSTHFDNGTKPLITTATNSVDLVRVNNATVGMTLFQNISFSNTAGTRGIGFYSSSNAPVLVLVNCILDGFTKAITSDASHSVIRRVQLSGCEIKNCAPGSGAGAVTYVPTGGGQERYLSELLIDGCWIHDTTGAGSSAVYVTSYSDGVTAPDVCIMHRSIVSANVTGITSTTCGLRIINSAIANNSSDGINASDAGGLNIPALVISNSIVYGNGGWGITSASGSNFPQFYGVSRNNAFGANTSGARNQFPIGFNDIDLSADPFTSSTDFTLNNTAGGGEDCKAAGFQFS